MDIACEVQVQIEFWNLSPGSRISASIHLLDKMKTGVLASANLPSANLGCDEWYGKPYPVGLFQTSCTLPGDFLNVGPYHVNVIVLTDVTHRELLVEEVVSFDAHEYNVTRKEFVGEWLGVVRPRLAWRTRFLREFQPNGGEGS